MLEIFQSLVRADPVPPESTQTIEKTELLETLGYQREPDALRKTPAFFHRLEGMTAMADRPTVQRRQTN